MSKELEALKRVEKRLYGKIPETAAVIDDDLYIIEIALKEHELMKQTKSIVADKKISDNDLEKLKNQRMFITNLDQCEIKPLFNEETQKKLKALEIIKEKKVDIARLDEAIKRNDLSFYNYYCYERLTKKEYDLLKEVLL